MPLNARCARASLAMAAALAASPAHAQPSTPLPLWELGAFGVGVSQQAYPGSDQQVTRGLALPYLIYRGKFLRADRETAGLRAVVTPRFEIDIGVAGSFGARSDEVDARRGMPDLGTLVEFGPRLKWNLGEGPGGGRWRLELPLRGVFDLSDSAAHRGMAFQPEIAFQRRAREGWAYATGLSAIVADRRLARTFYAVDPAFATPDRPAYAAQSGLVAWRVSASLSRNLGPDWRLFGFGRVDDVRGAANEHSPLVRRATGTTWGLGVAYTWVRSESLAQD
jgi:MipA family protein